MNPKLIAYGLSALGVLLVTGLLGSIIWKWRADSEALPLVQMRLAATLAATETARQIRGDVLKGYQDEITKLQAAADKPARVIRLCNSPSVPPAGASPGGPDDPSTGAGALSQENGRDFGPRLYRDADACDVQVARLRGLQEWASKVTAAK